MNVTSCSIPANSKVKSYLNHTDYWDSFETNLNKDELDIYNIYLGIFSHPPQWLKRLFTLQEKMATVLSLKSSSAAELNQVDRKLKYKIGDKVGLFTLLSVEENEIILGDDDKHLDFRVSVQRLAQAIPNKVVVTTLVQYNNWFGKVYFFLIRPFHQLGVSISIKNAVKENRI